MTYSLSPRVLQRSLFWPTAGKPGILLRELLRSVGDNTFVFKLSLLLTPAVCSAPSHWPGIPAFVLFTVLCTYTYSYCHILAM